MIVLWVALGGGIGAAARHGVNVWSSRVLGTEFPWHTLIVNLLGCFLMGLLIGSSVLVSILAVFAGLFLSRAVFA
jgi:fluoride exporter